jgi:hypothetical protein
LIGASSIAMRGELAVDGGVERFELVSDVIEECRPKRGDLTVGLS